MQTTQPGHTQARSQPKKQLEAGLFRRWRDHADTEAREQLVRTYLPLARHMARRFHGRHEAEDLVQVASYGLLKAIDGFDPERGLAFTSYAIPTIAGELKRYARDTGWGVRVPRGLQERALEVERAIEYLTGELRRSPTIAEIAAATSATSEEVLEALEASASHTVDSLDAPYGDDEDGGARVERLGADDAGYELVEDVSALEPVLRDLPPRERTILALRFGAELSQAQIAERVGISQMHVSRLLRRTLESVALATH